MQNLKELEAELALLKKYPKENLEKIIKEIRFLLDLHTRNIYMMLCHTIIHIRTGTNYARDGSHYQ